MSMYEMKKPNISGNVSPRNLIEIRVEIGKMVAQTFPGLHGSFPAMLMTA